MAEINLDDFFGIYGFEITLYDKIKSLVPDAVINGNLHSMMVPTECLSGEWVQIKCLIGNNVCMSIWMRSLKAFETQELKEVIKSGGVTSIWPNLYLDGEAFSPGFERNYILL